MRYPCSLVLLLFLLTPGVHAESPAAVQLTPNPIPDATWVAIDSFGIDPSVTRVVYESNPTGATAYQVLSVPIVGGAIAEVSHAGATGNIQEYKVTGDGSRVVYRASHTLRSALIGGGGHVELPETSCQYWQLSSDGSMVAYIAEGEGNVMAVPSTGGTPEIIGHGDPDESVTCSYLIASPGGAWLAFAVTWGAMGGAVYVTTWDGSGNERVREVWAGTPLAFFSPDDSRVFGRMQEDGLYSFSLSGGSSASVFWDWVCYAAVSPIPVQGSYYVVFNDYSNETYSLPIHSLGGTVTLYEDGCVPFEFTPDGEHVILRDSGDLYAVPTVGGAVWQLDGSGHTTAFKPAWGDRVVYKADELQPGVYELFVVDIAGGEPLRISTPLPAWGNISDFAISSDGQTVVYLADVEEDSEFQLFAVQITGGQSLAISSDITTFASRTVRSDFLITPGDDHVVYRTGSVSGEPAEVLFSVALDTDGDGDDVLDSVDCDSVDPSVWAFPGEVVGLTLAAQTGAPDVTVLDWTPPAELGGQSVQYDLLRVATAADFATTGSEVTCVLSGGSSPTAQDPEVPDGVFFYLARAVNACGNGASGPGRPAADASLCG